MPAVPPQSVRTWEDMIKFFIALVDGQMDLPVNDEIYFAERLAILVGSCDGKN